MRPRRFGGNGARSAPMGRRMSVGEPIRAPKRDPRHRLGARAEDAALAHYQRRGFVLVERNVRMGRFEIDLVVRRGASVALVEVRSRHASGAVHPALTIRGRKAEHVRRAAHLWLHTRRTGGTVRIDVVAATELPDGAFELDVYENVLTG
jgi:putative endonuclease